MKKSLSKKNPRNKGFIDIYGLHAVEAAINNPKRTHKKLLLSESKQDFLKKDIKKLIQQIVILPNKEMIKLYGGENNHQGVVLTTSKIIQPSLDQILNQSKKNKTEIIIVLDQVTDPHNIGSIMRSSLLFNCKTLIVTKDHSPDITPSMAKAASGALEAINYVKVTNLSQTINKFKKNNFWIYGLDIKKNDFKKNFEFPKKCLFIFGSEGKGIRKQTLKVCDDIISLPINKNTFFKIDSLNVSNACSIILYEYYKNNF